MALTPGTVAGGTGLAKDIANALVAKFAAVTPPYVYDTTDKHARAFIDAIAAGIVDHIQNHADVSVTYVATRLKDSVGGIVTDNGSPTATGTVA